MTAPDLAAVAAAVAPHGLLCRGGFHPGAEDGAPEGCATLVMIGNAGPAMWAAFAPRHLAGRHPLNAWARAVLTDVARDLAGRALFPFDGPPYLPFLRWARRAEGVHASPIGPFIHPEYGMWHAYRGALSFTRHLDVASPAPTPNPCDTCPDRACLSTCPVGAFSDAGYDVGACAGHIATPEGADCMDRACRARRACPLGRDYHYGPAHARFHMEKFLAARRGDA
jgi:hypothetical protein